MCVCGGGGGKREEKKAGNAGEGLLCTACLMLYRYPLSNYRPCFLCSLESDRLNTKP